MYDYRKMTAEERHQIVEVRRRQERPWHSPPHWDFVGERQFIISAACFEHSPIIGKGPEWMTACETSILELCEESASALYAWCLLPNHYHVLLRTDRLKDLRAAIGKLHGRTSFYWNGEDDSREPQVWHNCFDREIKSHHRHFWASVNYIHNNPVKHGYTDKWQDWPWSSASDFLQRVGRSTAEKKIWREYPILDYGKKWDVD